MKLFGSSRIAYKAVIVKKKTLDKIPDKVKEMAAGEEKKLIEA